MSTCVYMCLDKLLTDLGYHNIVEKLPWMYVDQHNVVSALNSGWLMHLKPGGHLPSVPLWHETPHHVREASMVLISLVENSSQSDF